MIPKIIHYCWFGGKPLTPLAEECIASWKAVMPEYEIKRWDESNFDFSDCEFANRAYENKKWAFVADYFRAWVLYNHGGIYLDTDVKVFKKFDSFLNDKFFIGFEEFVLLEADTIGCEMGHLLMKSVLDTFSADEFNINEGLDKLCTMPQRITKAFLQQYKVKYFYNRKIKFEDITIYPKNIFSPIDFVTKREKFTSKTISAHLFNGSWLDESHKPVVSFRHDVKQFVKRNLYRTLGYKTTQKLLYGRKNK